MIIFESERKVYDNKSGEVKDENVLRCLGYSVDFLTGAINTFWHIGFINAEGFFEISNGQPLQVVIQNIPEQPIEGGIIPAKPYFNQIITPSAEQSERDIGDFRIQDIERMIIDNGLMPQFSIKGIETVKGSIDKAKKLRNKISP